VSAVASASAASWPGGYPAEAWPGSPLRRFPPWQWTPPSLLAPSWGTSDKGLLCQATCSASSHAHWRWPARWSREEVMA